MRGRTRLHESIKFQPDIAVIRGTTSPPGRASVTPRYRHMRIAVLVYKTTPLSIRRYVRCIVERLPAFGIAATLFESPERRPEADMYWDPRTGGGRAPTPQLLDIDAPLAVTLHDVAHLSLPWREFYGKAGVALRGWIDARRVKRDWSRALESVRCILVPSETSRLEAVRHLRIPYDRISVVPHGAYPQADADLDRLPAPVRELGPYLLHVSHYQPRKNVSRILAAHRRMPRSVRPNLVMKLFDYDGPHSGDGITLLEGFLPEDELAALYSGALGFVFPSLNEGFGLPILEAMSCGCPVITSRGTACAEVSGDAALLVDPRSVTDIAEAMRRLASDSQLRERLSEAGKMRAREFDWDRAAAQHAELFRATIA